VCEEFVVLKRRLKKLEEDIDDLREVRRELRGDRHELREDRHLSAGKLGRTEHVSVMSTRPKDVFGELVNIKNVSAKNAMAVYGELVPFLQSHEVVDRETVLKELFPRTGSSITNDINYWYNACKGVLDHLIEEGFVQRLSKNKYRWVGERAPGSPKE
jgi:hypothetical protein